MSFYYEIQVILLFSENMGVISRRGSATTGGGGTPESVIRTNVWYIFMFFNVL